MTTKRERRRAAPAESPEKTLVEGTKEYVQLERTEKREKGEAHIDEAGIAA